MAKPQSFSDIIDLWPTPAAAGAEIGATSSLVSKWRRRDSIPAEWWSAILATGVAKAAGLTADTMTQLAARELAEARA